jgi:hypothetical protein
MTTNISINHNFDGFSNKDNSFYTLKGYCEEENLPLSSQELRNMGRRVSSYCRGLGVEFENHPVGYKYPLWILDQFFKHLEKQDKKTKNKEEEKEERKEENIEESIKQENEDKEIKEEIKISTTTCTNNSKFKIQNSELITSGAKHEENIQTFLNFVQSYLITQPSTIIEMDLVNSNLKILADRINTIRINTKICA